MKRLLLRLCLPLCLLTGLLACEKNEDPIALFTVSPTIGHYSQKFTFDASNSRDPDHRDHELQFRWDFTEDGNWDTDWQYQKTEEHYYADRGIYTVRLQVKDPRKDITEARRTVDVSLLNRKGILVDPRDGYDYKTVLIDSIWWMAQDLHHGKWLSMWERAIQKNNGIVERYGETDFEDLDLLTGYYNYGEAMNYQYQEKNPGICPPGWYIPDNAEWNSLINHLGEDKDPAIFLSVIGDEGVNLSFTGRRFVDWGISRPQPGGLYWSSSGDFGSTPYTFNLFYFPKDTVNLGILTFAPSDSMYVDYFDKYALTLRCVKKNEQ